MSTAITNNFQQYSLTEDEELKGAILTELNVQVIQNKLALAMLERASLSYDPSQPISVFVQQEAALMGEISAYTNILDNHKEVIAGLTAGDINTDNYLDDSQS